MAVGRSASGRPLAGLVEVAAATAGAVLLTAAVAAVFVLIYIFVVAPMNKKQEEE